VQRCVWLGLTSDSDFQHAASDCDFTQTMLGTVLVAAFLVVIVTIAFRVLFVIMIVVVIVVVTASAPGECERAGDHGDQQ
jgi:hypothetical protein